LFPLTILALWAVVGMLRWWKIAWMQAMFVQGTCLLISLILYFLGKPNHIFLLMGTGVFMVLYLNFANKQNLFQSVDDAVFTGKE